MSLSLIVTADDFGIGLKTSEGIIRAHLHGPVTAASVMTITGDHLRASVPLLEQAPNLDLGLHLVLTGCGGKAGNGPPVVGAGRSARRFFFQRPTLVSRVHR